MMRTEIARIVEKSAAAHAAATQVGMMVAKRNWLRKEVKRSSS